MTELREFTRLAERIPEKFIKNPPQGKYGKYVGHVDIQQIAFGKLNRPASFEVLDFVRGHIPAWQSNNGKRQNPERPQGIVACLARLTAVLDGETYVITEIGVANSPEVHSDGENLKTAASDAYKRCWMRLGLGLELWVEQGESPSPYFLHNQLLANESRSFTSSAGSEPSTVPSQDPADDPERPF